MNDWTVYLEPGETLLWEGRPRKGIRLRPSLFLSAFGVPFLVAGLLMLQESFAGLWASPHFADAFPLFGGILFSTVGSALVFGIWVYEAKRHRWLQYALTDQRAYVRLFGAVHVTPYASNIIDATLLDDGSGTVTFGPRNKWKKAKAEHSFEDIANAAAVADLFKRESL